MTRKQQKRQMRNPEVWRGKCVPRDMEPVDYDSNIEDYWDICDDCQAFYPTSELHSLLYPQSEADLKLQEAVGVEEAQGFCPDCLAEVERKADRVDPNWRERHRMGK